MHTRSTSWLAAFEYCTLIKVQFAARALLIIVIYSKWNDRIIQIDDVKGRLFVVWFVFGIWLLVVVLYSGRKFI